MSAMDRDQSSLLSHALLISMTVFMGQAPEFVNIFVKSEHVVTLQSLILILLCLKLEQSSNM